MITWESNDAAVADRQIAGAPHLNYQKCVDDYFRLSAHYWKDVYQRNSVLAAIYQQRFDRVLEFIDRLELPKTDRVLEIGCGAGLTTVAIAEHGNPVDAVDTVPDMIGYTRHLADQRGVSSRVRASLGDIHHLKASDNTYALVVAIGVLPWIREIEPALAEMRRVLRPGGVLIVTMDTRWALNRILDPILNPILQPLKRSALGILRQTGWRNEEAVALTMSCRRFDRWLRRLRFSKLTSTTLGFGPFTFLGFGITTPCLGHKLNRELQAWADRRVPVIRSLGAHYLVAARKEG